MHQHSRESDNLKRSLWRRWLPVAVIVAAIAAVWASGLTRYLSLASIADHRDMLKAFVAAHTALAFAIYLAVYFVCIALSMPGGTLLTVLGGFLFGWLAGGVATVFAATAGATVIFLIARSSFGEFLAERVGARLDALATGFREDAFHYLLFLRLVPLFPFWLVNIAPALFKVGVRTFVVSTFIGIIPGTFAFAMLGAGFDSIIMAQRRAYLACLAAKGPGHCSFELEPGALVTPELAAAFVALGLVALVPVAWKHLRKKRAGGRSSPGAGQKG